MFDLPQPIFASPRHGATCPTCGEGKLFTAAYSSTRSKHINLPILVCTRKPNCKHVERAVMDRLEGDGKVCRRCNFGKMVTKVWLRRGTLWGKRLLECTNGLCRVQRWNSNEYPPVLGHGKACGKCRTGKLFTKPTPGPDGKTVILLACNTCHNAEWPEEEFRLMQAKAVQ